MNIIISPSGQIRFIYSDDLIGLTQEGSARTRRASRVEPEGNGWMADLSPVEGPKLGPFVSRGDALGAEVEWLEKKGIPT